jgi:ankyrin repeat protein
MTTTAAGVSPLYIASHLGRIEIVEALLRTPGIDVDLASLDNHRTPLYAACAEGRMSVVRALLEARCVHDPHDGLRVRPSS